MTRESPCIGRLGGPGDFGLDGGWPIHFAGLYFFFDSGLKATGHTWIMTKEFGGAWPDESQ